MNETELLEFMIKQIDKSDRETCVAYAMLCEQIRKNEIVFPEMTLPREIATLTSQNAGTMLWVRSELMTMLKNKKQKDRWKFWKK